MVERIQLLRNIGQFDNVVAGGQIPLTKLTLVYAENGRGKTTLAAVLRSLATGDPILISERQRLAAPHPPHVVLAMNGAAPFVFENGAWSATLPSIAIFDDRFVAENICSGIDIETQHRQNLHELLLGAEGVALHNALQSRVARIEEHNRELRVRADAIPAAARGELTVEAFCALEPMPDVPEAVQEAERALAAAKASEAIREHADFASVELPAFDLDRINAVLQRSLQDLDSEAAARVQAHIATLGRGGELWVGDGMQCIARASDGRGDEICPFCAQDLNASPLIAHYRAYFSEAYADLKRSITDELNRINRSHAGDVPAAFERGVRVLVQTREFWRQFTEVPEINLDTAATARAWKAARDGIVEALRAKQDAPLDPAGIAESVLATVSEYDAQRRIVAELSRSMVALNAQIAIIKEQSAAANLAALGADLIRLRAVEARYAPATAVFCQAYIDEKVAKIETERLRDEAREELDRYREQIFTAYEAAINTYLGRFNAGFRLGNVCSINTRGGSSCSYSVLVNNVPVALTAGAGEPSFRNTLSAGDRNTLALAFFFSTLDRQPNLAQMTVVIDDPMTSLDEHRSLTTIQEMRRLAGRVNQLIVLSHSKAFLCDLWDGADSSERSAMKIIRDGEGSTLAAWDVRQDSIREHDKRHGLVADYIRANNAGQERAVAAALRHILEAFIRVAYPESFAPGSLLGPFLNICRQRVGTAQQLLSQADIAELDELLDYANTFHHDTNPAWETEVINDQQLLQFSRRTLAFTRRA